ncbi:MAG: helix-turn-helix domain-containing protein [Pirellulales bacterium]|nr:helix-turn-helix domain-containing protein [Pirellulales bacterium]
MKSLSPNPLYIRRTYHDIDLMSAEARQWDLDFHQLDPGPFRGDLLQFAVGEVMVTRGTFNRALRQDGSAPPGVRTFGIPADPAIEFHWRGKDVTGSELLAFPHGAEIDSDSPARFDVFTVSIPDALFEQATDQLESEDEANRFLSHELATVHPKQMRDARGAIAQMCEAVVASPDLLHHSRFVDELEQQLPRLIAEAVMQSTTPNGASQSPSQRALAVKRAVEYVSQNRHRPILVTELCRAAQVSQRTLEYAFRDRYGISPKAYTQALRLGGVRRDLHVADPANTTVTEVALSWGFWHMGQFAADYRQHFGELPRDTFSRT